MNVPLVGAPLDRVDGRLKITGAATYSAEWPLPNLAYGYLVLSTIAAGRIARIDTSAARAQNGVIEIMTPDNAPRVQDKPESPEERYLMVLQDAEVRYDRQPVAVVIANSFEAAKYASSLVRVDYRTAKPILAFAQGEQYAPPRPRSMANRQTHSAAMRCSHSSKRRFRSITSTRRRRKTIIQWSRMRRSRAGTARCLPSMTQTKAWMSRANAWHIPLVSQPRTSASSPGSSAALSAARARSGRTRSLPRWQRK
jgi:hypothetical protein